jgi:DNA-directed RNA polymerase
VSENNIDLVMKIADDPVNNREWLEYEDPWQSLASIFDLADALNSGDPESHLSRLHIH